MANSSSPTVSVVMPTYNRADLLPGTIASILSQDFDDLELLIVDDPSTDNTAEVIKEIQDQDPRLRYVQLPENRGIGFARDAGLQHVSGKYIALADSDDLWLPGKLTAQVEVLQKYPEIDILFGDFWNINHIKGTEESGFAQTQAGMKHLAVRHIADDLWLVEGGVETSILRSNFIAVPTMVLRATVFKKVGSFNASLRIEDLEFVWRAAVLGAQYAYLNRLLIERHKYQSSVTAHIADAAIQKLKALKVCRRTCEMAQRLELLDHIRAAEVKTWRRLIWAYGYNGQRAEAVRAFGKSLPCGFSARNLFIFAIALLGPQALSFVQRARTRAST